MSDLFRNHIVGFPTKWLIYSLHHKQLKVSYLLTFILRGVSNKSILVSAKFNSQFLKLKRFLYIALVCFRNDQVTCYDLLL